MKKFTLFLVAMTMSLFSFAQTPQMSGTYTVGTGGTYDYASMADAGMAIKSAEFTGDVTLLICTDLTETINTGIVNKSNYTLTIRPDKDENRTITYTTATDNTGPTGVFVIGGDMTKTPGSTIGWASVPTKNVIVDGAAEGKTTPRLKITNEKWGTNVILYGNVQDVVIRNCILVGRSSSTAYALVFRSENYSKTSKDIAPKNCLVENCILQSSSPSSQTVYFQGNQANSVAGWPASITIRNSTIKARTRGIYVRQVCNLNVEGCTFDMSNSTSGILAHAIMGEGARGTINVKGNKFIKNSTANTYGGAYGLQTITASGGADVWVIENNYFAGYDALKAISTTTNGTEARLVAVRCGDYCEVRHNTFHMPNLTKDQASKLVSASPTTLLWLAGSHQYPVQNNIFVCEETTANVSLIRGGLNENVTGNVFYHKGGNAAIVAAAPSCMTFANLETSYPTQAATSKWTNVTFADAANGDLSLDGSSDGDANLAVDRLAEVLTDINGKARREKTYAGAYEGGEFPAEVCKVDVTVTPVGSGIVEGAGECAKGSDVTLTPKPNTGYEFTGWTFEDETTSTDNPLIITVDGDRNITANFAKKQYTLTVLANDDAKGDVTGNGTYEYGTEVEITATPKSGYEFTGWSNGSKENPLTITMEENTELTANFRAILPTSITLYAHPVKDYSASIVGTMKRAIQNGENTIVLTHGDNGTPHIYNIAHATKEVTEISQVGVHAAADGFLSISDIAVTEDGKLVACNYVHCTFTPSNTSYFYIWNDLAAAPSVWFTSQKSGNYNDAYMGYTMALKGTSQNAEVTISAFNKSNSNTRYSHLYVVDGTYTDASYKYSRDNAALHPNTLGKNTYELNASPLAAGKWIVDGELASPIEFVEKDAVAIDTYTALNTNVLGKKYNGASYLFHKDHHLMIAPYAADDKLAGIKVLGITDGFGSAVEVTTSTNLVSAVNAVAAAATAYVDGDGDLTIYLFADSKVYTFSEKEYTAQTYTVTATAGEGGSVEGGGTYEEGATATLTATPNEHYTFTNWTFADASTSTENPLTITVNSDVEVTASFTEDPKYTINAHADHTNKGYVTGGGENIYVGTEVVLKATAKSGYYFTQWRDGNTDNPRTIEVTAAAEYIAEFAEAHPRAWAYDLTRTENGENYDFTFKTTSAGTATLIFKNKEGNILDFGTHAAAATTAEEKTITIAKTTFDAATQDIYWEVQMDGNEVPSIAEITDQTRGIYDFYNMMGVVVDNNTDSKDFGKIYIQQSYQRSYATSEAANDGITDRANTQLSGIFVYNQKLEELQSSIQPSVPSGHSAIGSVSYAFHRLNIDPVTGNLVYSHAVDGQPGVFAINRDDMEGAVTNLLTGVTDLTRTVAHCFDAEGILYVMNIASSKGTIYKVQDGVATPMTEATAKLVNPSITMVSDGKGGLWVSQNRGQMDDAPYYYQLVHVKSNGEFDWAVNKETPHGFEGSSSRGALAYDVERQILAQGRNGKVELYTVNYEPTITLTPLYTIASDDLGNSIDGLAFDYAGDLYVVNSSKEKFQKFTLPSVDNICTVPAPKSQAIEKEQKYTVTVEASPAEGGLVSGGGEAAAGAQVTVSATANTGYRFVNWTKGGDEESTDASFSYTVPAEDVTLIANFEKISYTLTVFVNDETKGTIDVTTGSYEYGSEVTLTATPNPGYKLLAWSNKAKTPSITITMDNNKAVSAYFVKDYDVEPTISVTQIWKNTDVPVSTNNGYQAVGWGGKIYLKDRLNRTIWEYSSESVKEVYTLTDDFTSESALKGDQSIAVDNAGNLIVRSGSGEFHTSPVQVTIYRNGEKTGKTVDFTLPVTERCDFITASGDIFSEKGGYIYFLCKDQKTVSRLFIKNGAITAEDVAVDVVATIPTAASSQSNVVLDIYGNIHTQSKNASAYEYNITTLAATADPYLGATTKKNPNSTIGGCTFELGGKELWAYAAGTTNYSSEWELSDANGGLVSDGVLCINDLTTVKNNTAANWLNVQVVDENTAYIYQFCPTVGVAVWKVSVETEVNVTIDENADNKTTLTPHEGEVVNATVNRNFGANKILTVTLPFDMDATQISTFFGMATIYEFYNVVDAGEELHLQFSRTTSIEAGKPYIIQTAASGYDAEDGFTIEGVTVTTDLTPIELNGITMVPVLDGGGRLENANEYFLSNSALYCAGDYPRDLQGLRAYFTSNSSKTLRARVVFDDNEETSLPTITNPNNNVQKIVKNGQLIIIRGENQYNAQGQTISIE